MARELNIATHIEPVRAKSAQAPVRAGSRSVWPPQAATQEPCVYGRCPPEHNHPELFGPEAVGYRHEPEDLIPGWTVQQIGRDRAAANCPKYCILCWEAEVDLREHACIVLAILTP